MMQVTGGESLQTQLMSVNFMPTIEAEVIRGIRVDTAKGIDASGSAFEEYVEQYRIYGRIARGLTVSPVNLRVKTSDSLLDTLGATKIDANTSEICVRSDKEPIAEGLTRKRKFMGISDNTVSIIESKLEGVLVRALQ